MRLHSTHRTYFLLFLTFIFFTGITYPQLIMDKNLLTEINDKVVSKYGPEMKVQFIYNIDSLKNPNTFYPQPHEIYDEYNQLNNAVVFTSLKFENGYGIKGLAGVYKNGAIVWDSDTTINFEDMNALTLFSAADINRDGKTDLIFATDEFTQSSNGLEKLYIYSWDGSSGRLISELNDENASTITTLTGIGQFSFVDVNGDGIYEIRGLGYLPQEENVEKTITYYWDGTNYSFNTSMPQPQEYNFLTQDNIKVTVNAAVNKSDSGYTYNYLVQNLSGSTQEIYLIDFQLNIDTLTANFPPQGWDSVESFDLFGFEDLEFPGTSPQNHFIKIGDSASCGFKSYYLPSIINLYAQAYNETPSLIDTVEGHVITFNDLYENILTNSKKSSTIGPSNLFYSLNVEESLDTLISYKHRALSLGWIDNQGIVNSLDSKLDNARKKLVSGDSTAAKNILNAFVNEVEAQKGKHLTSEAYALLKYNAEYLMDKLK